VNRQIAVAVDDKATGARLGSPMPGITITDRTTGRARDLPAVTAMSDGTEGRSALAEEEETPMLYVTDTPKDVETATRDLEEAA
jgi:hypothetical protein